MAWELMPIEIGSKKLDAQVSIGESMVEIEAPFFKSFKDTDIIKIEKQSYQISSSDNVGGRDEVILITCKKGETNEHKQVKGRKDT
jgi:hypothetical protein|tara:strand:- start:541 stop:798 length:258 start_codon:yes stop_codon:yes gene_type:complete